MATTYPNHEATKALKTALIRMQRIKWNVESARADKLITEAIQQAEQALELTQRALGAEDDYFDNNFEDV